MDIGSVFFNATEDGKTYMSFVLDDVIKEMRFSLIEIPEEKRKENSPIYKVSAYKPKKEQ